MSDETGHGGAFWENLLSDVTNMKKSMNNQENPDNKPLQSYSNDQTAVQITESSQKKELDDHNEATTHMLMERKRRRKMKDMFFELNVLLSYPFPAIKADKSTIIDEAVRRIKTLEEEIKMKEKQKEERLLKQKKQSASNTNISREAFLANQVGASSTYDTIDVRAVTAGTNNSSSNNDPVIFEAWNFLNVVLSICGNEAQYFVCSSKKPGLMSSMIFVFERHGVDVISAHLSTHGNNRTYMLQARLSGICNQDGNSRPGVVELFKQAAREISIVVCSE